MSIVYVDDVVADGAGDGGVVRADLGFEVVEWDGVKKGKARDSEAIKNIISK